MSDEIVLGNKTYISSKRAAKACGYAQDYVGQLARGGVIDAQRIGGLWYVSMESLEGYKRNAEGYVPKLPEVTQAPRELDTIVSFDGKDYVSAARAAKLTGYNPDYVGQLARGGKILSRQVGNRWYVEREGLLAHKTQKDSLLAAVQADSVGLQRSPETTTHVHQQVGEAHEPYLTYIREDQHLMPVLLSKPEQPAPRESIDAEPHSVPVRVVRRASSSTPIRSMSKQTSRRMRTSAMTIDKAVKAVTALTVVIVVSYGFVSIKSESIYAFFRPDSSSEALKNDSMIAGASVAFERVGDMVENLVSPEIRYSRDR